MLIFNPDKSVFMAVFLKMNNSLRAKSSMKPMR